MNRSALLGLAGGAAIVPLIRTRARADDIPLRTATINIDSGAEPYYAYDAGFFKSAGLRVEFQQFNNGQTIAAVFAEKWDAADNQPVVDMTATYGNVPRFPIDDILFRD